MIGRPTKYIEETTIELTRGYFKDSFGVAQDNIPTVDGLACYLDVARDTIYEWKKVHPLFSDAIKAGESHQGRAIVNLMTDKERYTAGAIFVSKNIMGWSDKKDYLIDHTITAFEVLDDDS